MRTKNSNINHKQASEVTGARIIENCGDIHPVPRMTVESF